MSWPTVSLGNCGEIQGGLQVTSKRQPLPLSRPYLRVANVYRGRLNLTEIKEIRATQAEADRTRLESGDLLFVEGHANPHEVGRVAVWDGSVPDCLHQNHLIRVRLDPDVLLPTFAAAWFNSPAGASHFRRAGNTTSGLNTISANTVRSAPTLLPPLDEQRRIAAILDHTVALQTKRHETLNGLDSLKLSIFMDRFADAKPTALLGECGTVQGGLQVTRGRADLPLALPYLRVANVHRGRLDLSEVKSINATAAELGRTRLEEGDLLFVEGHANPREVGRVAAWDGSIADCVHQNHLIRLRADPRRLEPQFAAMWFNTESGAAHFRKSGRTTSGLNTISASTVRSAPTLLPPISEQQRYVRMVEHISVQAHNARLSLDQLNDLFASLQSRGFRGEL